MFSTQFVIAGLESIDVAVPMRTRLSMTVDDFGILASLAPAVAASFVVAFPVAGLVWPRFRGSRRAWFILAGFLALIVELLIMQAAFDLMPIAGARTHAGLLSQGLAGALGGWLFVAIAPVPGRQADA